MFLEGTEEVEYCGQVQGLRSNGDKGTLVDASLLDAMLEVYLGISLAK